MVERGPKPTAAMTQPATMTMGIDCSSRARVRIVRPSCAGSCMRWRSAVAAGTRAGTQPSGWIPGDGRYRH